MIFRQSEVERIANLLVHRQRASGVAMPAQELVRFVLANAEQLAPAPMPKKDAAA